MAQTKLPFFVLIAFLLIVFVLFLVFGLPKKENPPMQINANTGSENRNAATTGVVLDFAEVEKNADRYDGVAICLNGTYVSQVETSVLNPDGADRNADPFSSSIWIETGVPDTVLVLHRRTSVGSAPVQRFSYALRRLSHRTGGQDRVRPPRQLPLPDDRGADNDGVGEC